MSKKNKAKQTQATLPQQNNTFRWIASIVVAVGIFAGLYALRPRPATTSVAKNTAAKAKPAESMPSKKTPLSPAEAINHERLKGEWLRADGGYILEIEEAGADGKLKARYLNPNPINVARAEWKPKDGNLEVFIELRDVNYPGSTYTLDFDAQEDKLTGNYFQAVQQENFVVEFVRQK